MRERETESEGAAYTCGHRGTVVCFSFREAGVFSSVRLN